MIVKAPVSFICVLGYLKFDDKRSLTCLEWFISNVWDSFGMHFEGGNWIDY